MARCSSWLSAARLRTLPLAAAGIIAGSALAYSTAHFSWTVFTLTLLTALLLQVLSNFANDYGDFIRGTDNEQRLGPQRTLQSGAIEPADMRVALLVVALFTLLSGIALLLVAFKGALLTGALFFLVLGMAAIGAAVFYTVGKKAYGYQGLGDFFVLVFFGLVAVGGTYYLQVKQLPIEIFLPALTIGLFSTAVLHLNNMRDRENDQASGKRTVAVRLGKRRSKIYHLVLLTAGWLAIFIFGLLYFRHLGQWIFVLVLPLHILHIKRVLNNTVPQLLDKELKVIALSTFGLSLLLALGEMMIHI